MSNKAQYRGLILAVFLCGYIAIQSHTDQHKAMSTAIVDNGCASKVSGIIEILPKVERIDNYNLDSLRGDKTNNAQ